MHLGTDVQVDITSLAPDGLGLGVVDGVAVHVAGTRPGDRVTARIEHLSPHRGAAWATLQALVETDPANHRPGACPSSLLGAARCGGCPLMPVTAGLGQALKAEWLHEGLAPLAALAPLPHLQTASSPTRYRNRNILSLSPGPDGTPTLGSRAPRSAHIASMLPCAAALPVVDAVSAALGRRLRGVDADQWPRHLVVRGNRASEALVEAIFGTERSEPPPWLQGVGSIDGVVGWSWSVNTHPGDSIRAEPPRPGAGRTDIVERFGRLDLPLTTDGFAQLNAEAAGAIYLRAGEHLAQSRTVWDLYCGAGALGLHGWLAGGVDAVCGVETSLTSVCVARRVSGALGAPARFEVGTAALAFSGDWPAPGAVVVNPPRKGLDTDVLRGLVALRAPRIVYMSCDPATFARDALVLCGSGYQIGELEAWDLLPLTRHAEVLARFDLTAGRAAR